MSTPKHCFLASLVELTKGFGGSKYKNDNDETTIARKKTTPMFPSSSNFRDSSMLRTS